MNDDMKVLFRIGYHVELCISMESAIKIMTVLSEENILLSNTKYEGGVSRKTLTPWGTDDITISLISPAELLLRCAAGEK